jgi:hypothetical protein
MLFPLDHHLFSSLGAGDVPTSLILLGLRIIIELGDSGPGNGPPSQNQQEADNLLAFIFALLKFAAFWVVIGLVDYFFVGVWKK